MLIELQRKNKEVQDNIICLYAADSKQLASFRTYYTNFLNTKGWKGNFDAGLLWNRWMDRAY